MLTTQDNKLIMVKQDYNHLTEYLRKNRPSMNDENIASLVSKIEEAEVLEEDDLPWDIVCLKTRVTIRDKAARLDYTYTVVLPGQADHRRCKVSVFSPIGSALFGYKRGDEIYWQTTNGKRYFTIVSVSQNAK